MSGRRCAHNKISKPTPAARQCSASAPVLTATLA